MSLQKLALGTVQFGLNYGINNNSGIVSEEEIKKILDLAYANNIQLLDTAYAYGLSEEKIGKLLDGKKEFKIVSKLPECRLEQVEKIFNNSLEKLKTNKIYGYLFHSFQNFKEKEEIWNIFKKLKNENKIDKIGFSLYFPQELEHLLNENIDFNILQVPYNILDQRFAGYFDELKNRNIEVHVRSIYLQGLLLKPICYFDDHFKSIRNKIVLINNLAKRLEIDILDICANFVRLNNAIDQIIVGVDNCSHLYTLLKTEINYAKVESIYETLVEMKEQDENILIPSRWRK
jgi:aryl-alcohol dehydrogenase-like predicted oxidoreductase